MCNGKIGSAVLSKINLKSQDSQDNELITRALDQKECDDAYFILGVNSIESSLIQQLLEEKMELLEVIGTSPGAKQDGIFRLTSHNVNGFSATLRKNDHLDKLKTVGDDSEIDALAISEHWNNLRLKTIDAMDWDNHFKAESQWCEGFGTLISMRT